MNGCGASTAKRQLRVAASNAYDALCHILDIQNTTFEREAFVLVKEYMITLPRKHRTGFAVAKALVSAFGLGRVHGLASFMSRSVRNDPLAAAVKRHARELQLFMSGTFDESACSGAKSWSLKPFVMDVICSVLPETEALRIVRIVRAETSKFTRTHLLPMLFRLSSPATGSNTPPILPNIRNTRSRQTARAPPSGRRSIIARTRPSAS